MHAMTWKLCTCCPMRYDWSCSSCSSNFGYRDSQSARKMDTFVVVQRKRKRVRQEKDDTSSCSESASQVFSSENDIGNFVGVLLTDADRRKVLFNCWSPPSGFSFPYVTVGAQNRSFRKQRLNEFTWLAYRNICNGVFCKWCVVFGPQTVSRSAKSPGSLVSGPHCNYCIKRQRNITILTKTVTIMNYVQSCSINFVPQTDADKPRDVRNALNSTHLRWQLYQTYAFFCRVLNSAYRYFKTMLKQKFQARLLRDRSWNQFAPHAGQQDMTRSSFSWHYCQQLFLHLRICSRKTSKWRLRPKQQLCSILYRNSRF